MGQTFIGLHVHRGEAHWGLCTLGVFAMCTVLHVRRRHVQQQQSYVEEEQGGLSGILHSCG